MFIHVKLVWSFYIYVCMSLSFGISLLSVKELYVLRVLLFILM